MREREGGERGKKGGGCRERERVERIIKQMIKKQKHMYYITDTCSLLVHYSVYKQHSHLHVALATTD